MLWGAPNLTPSQMDEFQSSQAIHRIVIVILQAVHTKGGHVSWETPPSALTTQEEFIQEFFESADVACAYGWPIRKAWMFATTYSGLLPLGATCTHGGIESHTGLAGQRAQDGSFLSSTTAEYPAPLCDRYTTLISPLLSKNDGGSNIAMYFCLFIRQPSTR